jgi:hypothetical protein
MIFFYFELSSQDSFGLEESFSALQTGIISTEVQDFAVSNDFEIRVFQNGKIMRLSGITTTGEPYYIYQKFIGDEVILKGKILLGKTFLPLIQKEVTPEPQIPLETDTQLIMSTKIPHHTYANYPFIILVKVFDLKQNPQANFEQKSGALENVFVNVTITNQFNKVVTSLSGNTDSTGLFRGSHVVREGIDIRGEYIVYVSINDGVSSSTQTLKTFFRGDIRDYFDDDTP